MILFYLLAALGTHRIWNYEDIFRGARELLKISTGAKPLWCEACNAFWITAIWVGAFMARTDETDALAYLFSGYLLLRGSIWVYHVADRVVDATRACPAAPKPQAPAPARPTFTPRPIPAVVEQLAAKQDEYRSFSERVVLLTVLNGFDSSFSLCSVICDQARMLATDPKRRVEIWVMQTCNMASLPDDVRDAPNIRVRPLLPAIPFLVDEAPTAAVKIMKDALLREMIPLGSATIITHDLLFVSQYTAVAAAIHGIGQVPGFRWFHVAHSGPSQRPPNLEPETGRFYRHTLPKGHKVLCVSAAQRAGFAAHYATEAANILPVANACDPRGSWNLPARVRDLIGRSKLLEADVVQTLPISTTRMEAKGVDMLLRLFGAMRKQGAEVRLVLVTAHANGERERTALSEALQMAQFYGMREGDLLVTSLLYPETAAQGFSRDETQALFRLSNLFAYPSVMEACSLVTMEAALAGNLLVLNGSVPSMKDIAPIGPTIYYPWNEQVANMKNGRLSVEEFQKVVQLQAEEMLVQLQNDRALSNKMTIRRAHSYETIGAALLAAIHMP